MSKVKHKVKDREYDYPDLKTAENHCKQAVEQSKGKLRYRADGDDGFVIEAAPQRGER